MPKTNSEHWNRTRRADTQDLLTILRPCCSTCWPTRSCLILNPTMERGDSTEMTPPMTLILTILTWRMELLQHRNWNCLHYVPSSSRLCFPTSTGKLSQRGLGQSSIMNVASSGLRLSAAHNHTWLTSLNLY